MGFLSEAIRLIQDKQADRKNRERGEDYLRKLQMEELERRATAHPAAHHWRGK